MPGDPQDAVDGFWAGKIADALAMGCAGVDADEIPVIPGYAIALPTQRVVPRGKRMILDGGGVAVHHCDGHVIGPDGEVLPNKPLLWLTLEDAGPGQG